MVIYYQYLYDVLGKIQLGLVPERGFVRCSTSAMALHRWFGKDLMVKAMVIRTFIASLR